MAWGDVPAAGGVCQVASCDRAAPTSSSKAACREVISSATAKAALFKLASRASARAGPPPGNATWLRS